MSISAAKELIEYAENADLNEADTRFQLIDKLLQEVLGWPRVAFRNEKSTIEGFSDYHLIRPNGKIALIIEAKRTGIYFDLPKNFNSDKNFRSVKARTLLTSPSLKTAMIQAQRYCSDEGCEYGAVTNGKQLILFKAFERDKSWRDLSTLVISNLSWFEDNHNDALELLGYSSVIDRHSLRSAFDRSHPDGREIFFPKEKINSFNQIINSNALAHVIRPIVKKYFGSIDVKDPRFVQKCYVNQRAHDNSLKGIRNLIEDSITPFMESYGVSETEDSDSGGVFVNRLVKGVQKSAGSDVVVLFGGKGSGKSTFIKKVLMYKPPQFLKKHSLPIIVDLLSAPKDQSAVREHLWNSIISKLDTNQILSSERENLIKLFSDRYEVAERQDLKGLFEDSTAYNEKLNSLIAEWKRDFRYVAGRLIKWHKSQHRGVIVAIDNTDQLENELQDYAFSLAVEVSKDFDSVVLISMREERFYASKIRGQLDAYQNSAFHISSPTAEEVFTKRIEYVLELLAKNELNIEDHQKNEVDKFFRIFLSDFNRKAPQSPLNRFISSSAHGNIRLALDLFGDLVLSGYTNATEMTQATSIWNILIHQVLRPLLTPTRLFYDETRSKVPNLFQIRSMEGGSHFTGLRILKRLSLRQDPLAPSYISFAEVRSFFGEVFGSDNDFCLWIDRLLASNLIEASTRQDIFSNELDSIKITSFGQFSITELYKTFTYIELTSTDCGIREESTCNTLVRISNIEVQLINERKKLNRVHYRIEKADAFIEYLRKEEEREIEFYSLDSDYAFIPALIEAWIEEKPRVLRSAERNT
jgi:hypothetical protein